MDKERLKQLLLDCHLMETCNGKCNCFQKEDFKRFLENFLDKKDPYDYSQVDYPSIDWPEFKLTPVEVARYKTFMANHQHKDVEKCAIGGTMSIEFTSNGIGHTVKCKCGVCDQYADITDVDSW